MFLMKYLSSQINGDAARIATIGLLAARRSRGPLWRGLLGRAHLCGYVVELALKAAICSTLGVTEYPEKGSRLKESFKSHDIQPRFGCKHKLEPHRFL